ncbi:MAG TPA: class I SAM-dependent methyltransferase [Anaerolineales bacterium]|nr:class I SAM-dependent methyltransferase [Anaerolineales bacterium]
MDSSSTFSLLRSRPWRDYALLDTGDGAKLERFGPYTFARPEVQAMWSPALSKKEWDSADAVFQPTNEENGGHWLFRKKELDRWQMRYDLPGGAPLRFWAMTTSGRHLGVFPEAAPHWDLIAASLKQSGRPAASVLNVFGYTGLATLAAAAAGAHVTHVDASRKAVAWARENQSLSDLAGKPVRWIVDDALKFVEREGRRGARYDGLILDPPKFGRGPKGEVWEAYKSLPRLLKSCAEILSDQPLFIILTVYAVKASAIHIAEALAEVTRPIHGKIELGELVTPERSAGRLLSQAVFARWASG